MWLNLNISKPSKIVDIHHINVARVIKELLPECDTSHQYKNTKQHWRAISLVRTCILQNQYVSMSRFYLKWWLYSMQTLSTLLTSFWENPKITSRVHFRSFLSWTVELVICNTMALISRRCNDMVGWYTFVCRLRGAALSKWVEDMSWFDIVLTRYPTPYCSIGESGKEIKLILFSVEPDRHV